MSAATVTAIAAVAGAGAAVYGASQAGKAQDAATAAGSASAAASDNSAWHSYLLSRGLDPTGAATGQIPQGAAPVNTRLPLWASVTATPPGGTTPARWAKVGSPLRRPTFALSSGISYNQAAPPLGGGGSVPVGTPGSANSPGSGDQFGPGGLLATLNPSDPLYRINSPTTGNPFPNIPSQNGLN